MVIQHTHSVKRLLRRNNPTSTASEPGRHLVVIRETTTTVRLNVIAILKAVMKSHVGDRGHVYDSHHIDCMTVERDISRVLERVVAFSSVESRLDCSERGEPGQI